MDLNVALYTHGDWEANPLKAVSDRAIAMLPVKVSMDRLPGLPELQAARQLNDYDLTLVDWKANGSDTPYLVADLLIQRPGRIAVILPDEPLRYTERVQALHYAHANVLPSSELNRPKGMAGLLRAVYYAKQRETRRKSRRRPS